MIKPVISVAKKIGGFLFMDENHPSSDIKSLPMVVVTDKNGWPIRWAGVFFKKPGSDSRKTEFVRAGEVSGNSDAKGEYKADFRLQPGTYDLIVKKQGFIDERKNGIQVANGKVQRIHIRLIPDKTATESFRVEPKH
jgi:hypothetical protein